MLKKFSFLLSLLAVVLMSSCSSKMSGLKSEYFTVTPQVLEVVGGNVPASIDGRFPEKFFDKKSVLTVTPVLKYNGKEVVAESMTFQGEKVLGNDRTVNYKNGSVFTLKSNFEYLPGMDKSELYLRFNVKRGKKTYTLPDVKVADGCVATSQIYRSSVASANIGYGEDAFQRVIKQAQQANIMFLIQQTNLRSGELSSEDMKALRESMKNLSDNTGNMIFENVEVAAYASPDGGISLNTDIAEGRERNAAKYMEREMKNAKLNGYIDSDYTAEDWEGFQQLVAASDLPDKDLILRVLSMYDEPEQREEQIKNISTVYKDLADEILPQLRRARITLNYQLIGRSDVEIMEQLNSDAQLLSLDEILYAAILTENTAEQQKIFKTAVRLHPEDYRAYNNLGVIAYKGGDYALAKEYFTQAVAKNSSAPEANINLGYLELIDGNVAAAEAYIGKGTGAKASKEAFGNLYIAQGQYQRAASHLEGTKTNGEALAQLLNMDYSKAKETLALIKNPDATTYYIMAVLGARTGNASLLYDGLRNAVKLDPSLARKAANDLEFVKYNVADILK